MIELENLDIAVIADRDQTGIMRLAGVHRFRVPGPDTASDVKTAFEEFSSDSSIGIIIISEEFSPHAKDQMTKLRQSKRVRPVVIEIPSGGENDGAAVKEYYQNYTKNLIGFNIEI